MTWPRYPAGGLARARADAQEGRVVFQQGYSRMSAGWLLGPSAEVLSLAARTAGISAQISRHPGDGRGCIEVVGGDLQAAYDRSGALERPGAEWRLFAEGAEEDAEQHALSGGVSVWARLHRVGGLEGVHIETRWLLLSSTEAAVRRARRSLKATGEVALWSGKTRGKAWATLLSRKDFDRARSRCLSEGSLGVARSGTCAVVAPARRPILAYEASGGLLVERLRQRFSALLRALRPAQISLPITPWSVSLVLEAALGSSDHSGVSFRLHMPGSWSYVNRTWIEEEIRDNYALFTSSVCSDPLSTVGIAMDCGSASGFAVSEHGDHEGAVSAATQEAECLLVLGEKNPPPLVGRDLDPLPSFGWRKAAGAKRQWVDLGDFTKP